MTDVTPSELRDLLAAVGCDLVWTATRHDGHAITEAYTDAVRGVVIAWAIDVLAGECAPAAARALGIASGAPRVPS